MESVRKASFSIKSTARSSEKGVGMGSFLLWSNHQGKGWVSLGSNFTKYFNFVFPLISHQIWCFLIPSCYGEQRTKYNRFLHLSGSRFSLFLFLTLPRVVPNVWHFPYFMGATSTNSLMIKLQPKIYDYIMLTVRILFIPSVCSQVPVIVICLQELRGLSVETFTSNLTH